MKDHYRLEHDLAFLIRPAAAGRLSGTEGARKAADYLLAELDALSFDSMLQPVTVPAARLTSTPKLVVDHQAFSPRRDFAELTALSAGGQVNGQLLVVREDDSLLPEELNGRVVLIPERPQGFNLTQTIQTAVEMGVAALLIEHGEPEWFHKTVYTGNGQIPVLRVKTSIAEKKHCELFETVKVLIEASYNFFRRYNQTPHLVLSIIGAHPS